MIKKYIVYCHTNIINDKKYIGITCQSFKARCKKDGIGYKECPHFWKAICKYGWNNFKHEILFHDLTKKEACEKEIELIEKYDLRNPNKGYNISKGGDSNNSEIMKEKWNEEEYRNEMKRRMKEAWTNDDKRIKRSQLAKNRWANKKFYEKSMRAVKEKCCKKVICVELNKIFTSLIEAAKYFNIDRPNISRAIKTGYKCGGYHWQLI